MNNPSSIIRSLLLLASIIFITDLAGQLEVTYIDENASDDLILYSQAFGTTTLLINKCGEVINQWEHEERAGYTARLLDDGNLVRAEYVDFGCCRQTSRGGRIQIIDWDQNIVWDHLVAKATETQHHDYVVMPSGNIMYLGWELVNRFEMNDLGIRPGPIELWSEFIREVKPVGSDSAEVIWEWHLRDHLIQNLDSTKSNYRANIKDHLGKVDPHVMNQPRDGKWHVNAIEYNPVRDEVMINSRDNHEFWIIDHSTTMEEAKGDSGGNSGKGGQILFRWGNPMAYGRGDVDDIRMFGSHGLTLIGKGERNEDYILFFNNEQSAPGVGEFSTVELIKPQLDADGNYVLDADSTYMLEDHIYVYGEDQEAEPLYSRFMSNAQQLPGGYLILEGSRGRIFEIDNDKNVTWEMRSRFWSESVFRAYSYSPDFMGFANRDLSPISSDFLADEFEPCQRLDNTTEEEISFQIYPNPTAEHLYLHGEINAQVEILSLQAETLLTTEIAPGNNKVNLQPLLPGVYVILIKTPSEVLTKRMVKM